MAFDRKTLYMVLGGLLALTLVFTAVVTFAQTEGEDEDALPPEAETEGENGDDVSTTPGWGWHGPRGFTHPPVDSVTSQDERLAEALGISVEELQTAYEEARAAAIEQLVDEGRITREQADQLLSGEGRFRGHFGRGFIDMAGHNELLAEALGISLEELQEARAAANAARLADMVEAGVLTQEQLDMMLARQAVQDYLDTEALAETLQDAYETAVEQAFADGAITQEQADQLLENAPRFAPFGGGRDFFGGRGFPGPSGRHHGRGFHDGPAPFFRGQPPANGETTVDPASNV